MRKACALLMLATVSASPIDDVVTPMWSQLKNTTRRVGDLTSVRGRHGEGALEAVRVAVDAVKNSTECEIRLLAYEFALRELPNRAPTRMVEVFDALELHDMCQLDRPVPVPLPPPSFPEPTMKAVFYVDPNKGNDKAKGTKAAPFKTVHTALAATRAAKIDTSTADKAITKAIVLRKGVHFLTESVNLTAGQDDGLLITNYAGEEAWLSGGMVLKTGISIVFSFPGSAQSSLPFSLLFAHFLGG